MYVLKPSSCLWLNMAARPGKTKGGKALRFACRNEERLRVRKVELEHFVNQYGVYICFLIETFLNPGQAVQLVNYVCHRTDRLTAGCGTALLVRRGIVHKSVSVPDRTHLEATVIQVILSVNRRKSLRLNFVYPPTDRSEPVRMFLWWVGGPVGW